MQIDDAVEGTLSSCNDTHRRKAPKQLPMWKLVRGRLDAGRMRVVPWPYSVGSGMGHGRVGDQDAGDPAAVHRRHCQRVSSEVQGVPWVGEPAQLRDHA